MDRIYSAQLEQSLTPWNNDDELEFENPSRIDFKVTTASPNKQRTEILNQAQIKKFHKLMEQHRERLRGKKTSNTRSMEIMEKDRQERALFATQKPNEPQKSQTQFLQQERDYRRSNTLSRLGEFLPTKVKSFHPIVKDNMEHEREILRTIYRVKTGNRNADKFYGTLNKKLDIVKTKNTSTALLNKNQMGTFNGQVKKLSSATINKTNPIKQIVQLKLVKYRSSRSIEKFNFDARKYKKTNKEPYHVLDRILVSL